MEQGFKKNLGIGFWIIVAMGIFLRTLAYLKNPSFWFDESALAYNILSLKYKELFGILHLQQVAPPLFLIISKGFVSVFGLSDMNLRFIPFLFGCLSFIPFFLVVRHIFEKPVVINFAMFLFAINPKLIYYGTEFKPYILDVFFALLLFYLFLKIDFKKMTIEKILLCGFIPAISVWFSFTSAIVSFVGFITILIEQKNIKKWMLFLTPTLFSYLIFSIYYFKISAFYKPFMLHFFKGEFNHYSIPTSYFFNNEFSLSIIIISLAMVSGIIYFMMEKKQVEIAFIMWTFVITILLSQLHLYPAYQRFVLFLLPFIIILISMTFNILIDRKSVQSRLVLLIILISLFPTSVTQKGSDARELTEYFLARVSPTDIIFVDNLALPDFLYYTYYTKMENKIIVPFDKIHNRIMYKEGSVFEFPEGDKFWFYSTRTKNFDTLINKKDDFETIKGYKILDKKIAPNGAILYVSRF